MIYKSELLKKSTIIGPLVERFTKLAHDNQTYETDFFLIIINAFYDPELVDRYVYGTDFSQFATFSFSKYMKWYFDNQSFSLDKKIAIKYPDPRLEEYKISVHIEKGIYLRFWEADSTLQFLYQLTRLCQGLHFDWTWKQEIAKYRNRQEFIREKIKEPLKLIDTEIYQFFKSTSIGQIRNAIAHYQYCLLNNDIKYLNYSEDIKKYSPINLMSYDSWEEIFHNTFVFRRELIVIFNDLSRGYRKYAEKVVGGRIPLRITKVDGSIEMGNYNLRKNKP